MYRHDGRPRDIEVDPEDILRAQARRRKRALVALAVAALLVAGAGGGVAHVFAQKAHAATTAAWSDLATCLVGAPLASGDKASAVVRDEQLVEMAIPRDKRAADPTGAWPARCAAPAHKMSEAVKNAGKDAPLAASSDKLAKALEAPDATTADLGALVDAVFADASALSLVHTAPPGATLPPEAAKPMTLETLPKRARMFGAPLTLDAIHPAPFGDTTLRFVVDDKDFAAGPHVCSLAVGSSEIVCKKIPAPAAKLSPGLRLWGTTADGAAPFVFAGDRGKSGIFRSDTGAAVVDKLENGAYGASAFPDGSLVYLDWQNAPPGARVVRVGSDGTKSKSLLIPYKESGNPYYATALFWDFLAYKSASASDDGIRLRVRSIPPSGDVGPVQDVGRIAEIGQIEGGQNEEPHLTACRAPGTFLVRAKGWTNTYVSFFVAGRWTAPVESMGTTGTLECRSNEAVISRVEGTTEGGRFHARVSESRCTVSGCTEHEIDMKKELGDDDDVMPRSPRDLQSLDVEGQRLFVWSAGDRGGVRMRVGPLKERVLIDDHVQNGAFREESSIVGIELLSVPGGAVLLVGALDGVYAWRVDPLGALVPLTTKAE